MLLSESCTGKQGRQHFTPRAKGTSDGAYAVATTSAAIGTAINATSSERHWTAYAGGHIEQITTINRRRTRIRCKPPIVAPAVGQTRQAR